MIELNEDNANWAISVDFFFQMKKIIQEKYTNKKITKKERNELFQCLDQGRHKAFIENNPLLKNNSKLKELAYGLL